MGNFFRKLLPTDTENSHQDEGIEDNLNVGQINQIKQKFHYSEQDMIIFHKIFREMDNQGTGCISIESIFNFLEEELNSVISPYLKYLFQLIDKETDDKITFPEWLPYISLYCLYSREQVIGFVFQMLDFDHDNNISKKDLMNFLVQERFHQKIFPFNYIKAVELMDIERPDKISVDQFRKIQMQIPFICYPAFRLQESLKKKIQGEKFWLKTYDKIKEEEAKKNMEKNKNLQEEKMKKKAQVRIDKIIERFTEKTNSFKINQQLFKQDRTIRLKERTNSDGKLDICKESPNNLIEQVFQQYKKQLKGQQNQRRFKDVRSLRCRSKSQIYIKDEITKFTYANRRKAITNKLELFKEVQSLTAGQKQNHLMKSDRKSIFQNFPQQKRQEEFISQPSPITFNSLSDDYVTEN